MKYRPGINRLANVTADLMILKAVGLAIVGLLVMLGVLL